MSARETPALVRWSGYIAVAIIFAIACGFLSHWQFSRNEERARQLALVENNYNREPVALGTALATGAELDPAAEWTPVEVTGTYLPEEQVLVRNRPRGGTSAFEVLVPFRLDDGRVLIIDRGWVPPGDPEPVPESVPSPPAGEVTVIVRLRPGEALPTSGRTADEGQVPTINLPLISGMVASGSAVETGAYGLMVSEDPAPAVSPSAIDPPTDDPGPHLSYAVQWILFAVMGFAFIGYVIVSERRIRREDAEDAASGITRKRPKRKRRDRDADAEDALIDSPEPAERPDQASVIRSA
ncbi:SURF1 family protein [Microbacterium sp. P04]|uniref:SURF1 family cytochrome oxidase biogenesis protein n=1 Tax=Microbacterium sp. P04 TaxID=3366947 RepID=UPI00374602BD